jgi:hypothetical protein
MAEEMQLEVAEILDDSTLVIGGKGAGRLQNHETLLVLGVGPPVRGTDLPLVVPKRSVEVTMVAPAYAIVRPEVIEEEVEVPGYRGGISALAIPPPTKIVKRRPKLHVEEKALAGNPGSTPIRVGDPVVRPNDTRKKSLRRGTEAARPRGVGTLPIVYRNQLREL